MEEANQEYRELLAFINQCPFGLIKADREGNILLLNGVGSNLLLPIALEFKLPLQNILEIIGHFDPALHEKVTAFDSDFGTICSNWRIKIDFQSQSHSQYLAFIVIRLRENVYQFAFNDISAVVRTEEKVQEMTRNVALQEGKLEMSTGILHDIGNAVTAFGSEVVRLSGGGDWRELGDIGKLIKLFEQKTAQLDTAMGAGKGTALLTFLKALQSSLKDRHAHHAEVAAQLSEITGHVQEILNIQRHYVKGKTKGERAPIHLRHILEDALAMQGNGFLKRGVKVEKELALVLPPVQGDKTKLIQVMINLLKNAGEAFDELIDDREKTLHLRLEQLESEHMLSLTIRDNAIGFEPGKGETFFQRGITSKNTGSGFGLHNCREIVETHQGQITMESEGPGKGTTIVLKLPYVQEAESVNQLKVN